MIISLEKLIEDGKIEKTGAKQSIKIKGVTSNILEVYRIPIEYLYYNDKNGRISSDMEMNNICLEPTPDINDRKYNDAVGKLIRNNGISALNKTKKDIQNDGQKVVGYVLNDGRIIDGNRRFTALRELQYETGKSFYFEAVILPFSYESHVDQTKIKSLELNIQMGIEEKQKYDAVDLAVDIYRTTRDEQLLSIPDYAENANMKVKEVQNYFNASILMREFLEFIGAKENLYRIIKESGTFSLFFEMGKTLNKEFNNDMDSQVIKNQTKNTFFAFVLSVIRSGGGDNSFKASHIREYTKNIIKSKDNSEFNSEVEEYVDELQDTLQEQEIVDFASLGKAITKAKESLNEFDDTYQEYKLKSKKEDNIDSFIKEIKKISKELKTIKTCGGLKGSLTFNELEDYQIIELMEEMRDIIYYSQNIFEGYQKWQSNQ